MSAFVVLRATDRMPKRWNGGGITQDVAVVPPGAGLADFGWRLSIAEVAAPGPFSIFPGVDRHLAMLSGSMVLEIAGESTRARLTPADEAVTFRGDADVVATPVGGAARDVNLMVRRDRYWGRLYRVDRLAGPLNHEAVVILACAPMRMTIDGTSLDLALFDAVRLDGTHDVHAHAPLMLAAIKRLPSPRPSRPT